MCHGGYSCINFHVYVPCDNRGEYARGPKIIVKFNGSFVPPRVAPLLPTPPLFFLPHFSKSSFRFRASRCRASYAFLFSRHYTAESSFRARSSLAKFNGRARARVFSGHVFQGKESLTRENLDFSLSGFFGNAFSPLLSACIGASATRLSKALQRGSECFRKKVGEGQRAET